MEDLIMVKDDETKVTITYKGRTVTTTVGKMHKLANSPKLLKRLANRAKIEMAIENFRKNKKELNGQV